MSTPSSLMVPDVGIEQPDDQVCKRRLATPALADDRQRLLLADRQVDVLDGVHRSRHRPTGNDLAEVVGPRPTVVRHDSAASTAGAKSLASASRSEMERLGTLDAGHRSEAGHRGEQGLGVVLAGVLEHLEHASGLDQAASRFITTTRSATSATTPMSWVMIMTAAPVDSRRSRMSPRIWAWMVTSSAVVGSSAMSTRGRTTGPWRSSPAGACRPTSRAGTARAASPDRGCARA